MKKYLAGLLLVLLSAASFAQPPNLLIETMSSTILERLNSTKNPDAKQVAALVDEVVMPHVDFQAMTAGTLGRFWKQATPEQQQSLALNFRALLLKTYSGALQQAQGATIKILPLRQDLTSPVIVKSEVRAKGQQDPIALAYRLEALGDDWKIVDLSILGVWLVPTYRDSFVQEINRAGIDGLIKTLQDKANKK